MNTVALSETRVTGKSGMPALVVRPSAPGSYPCVMILHERYGLTPHTEDLARRLAASGFAVVAPHLFFDFPDQQALIDAKAFAKPSDARVLELCEDAFEHFALIDGADPQRFGMIGVCQTGRHPLVWGAAHPLRASVTLYGAVYDQDWERTDLHPDGIDGLLDKMVANKSTDVLAIFGENDFLISIPNVQRFRNALEARDISYQVTIYPTVPHGWLNDTMPGRYREEPARAAWGEIVEYLHAKLAPNAGERTHVSWAFRCVKSVDYDFSKGVREA